MIRDAGRVNGAVLVLWSALLPGTTGAQQGEVNLHAVPVVDTHAHLDGQVRRGADDYAGAAAAAVAAMDRLGMATMVIMPPPRPGDRMDSALLGELLKAARKHPGRFAVLGGGWSLNGMIEETPVDAVDDALLDKFRRRAEQILAAGAVGFGEMTALHFSFNANHPFEVSPPDHPLFLLLADIAAQHGVPIDLHMEAVAERMPTPPELRSRSRANPPMLEENIAALERLLDHNRGATIVWTHLGWDNTGQRTIRLSKRLMNAHPNLVLAIKAKRNSLSKRTRILKGEAGIKPKWAAFIAEYGDRIVVGSDQFSPAPGSGVRRPPGLPGMMEILNRLPRDLAYRIAVENPRRIYRLGQGP